MSNVGQGQRLSTAVTYIRHTSYGRHPASCQAWCRCDPAQLHALHMTAHPVQQAPSRGGVPAIEIAIRVSQDNQVGPGSNGGGVDLPTAQQAPLRALGLGVADLQRQPRGARCQLSPAAPIRSPDAAHAADESEVLWWQPAVCMPAACCCQSQPGQAPPRPLSVRAISAASAEGPQPVTLDKQCHLSSVHPPRLAIWRATRSLAHKGRPPCGL